MSSILSLYCSQRSTVPMLYRRITAKGPYFLSIVFLLSLPLFAHARTGSVEEAKWFFERLTGTKISYNSDTLKKMSAALEENKKSEAFDYAINHPGFLNTTVKQFALKMSTREETLRIPLNDFAATFIGVARDDIDARKLLYENFYYTGNLNQNNLQSDVLLSNKHYEDLEKNSDIGAVLVQKTGQQVMNSNNSTTNNPDPAGVLTSRSFLQAHATAGTNRRLVEYSFRAFLCSPIESFADTAAPDSRIGRDIDRFPGGDHVKFQTSCKGCHSVMDGFRGAFAKWDFTNDRAVHSGVNGTNLSSPAADLNGIMNKMNQNNEVFPNGYATTDDSWINHANRGNNAKRFSWRYKSDFGYGVKSFGETLANSEKFSECFVKRAFDSVCKKALPEALQDSLFSNLARKWENEGEYKIKALFKLVAASDECTYQGEI